MNKQKYKKILDINPLDWEPIISNGNEKNEIYVYQTYDMEHHKRVYNSDIPFQMVYFPNRIHESNIYIKYPTRPFFIEIPNVGMNSRGGKRYGTTIDPYSRVDIDVVICENKSMFKRMDDIGFMELFDINILHDQYYVEIPEVYTSEYVLDISHLNIFGYEYLLVAVPQAEKIMPVG